MLAIYDGVKRHYRSPMQELQKKGTAGYGKLTGGTHNYADGTIPPNLLRYGKRKAGTNVPWIFESL